MKKIAEITIGKNTKSIKVLQATHQIKMAVNSTYNIRKLTCDKHSCYCNCCGNHFQSQYMYKYHNQKEIICPNCGAITKEEEIIEIKPGTFFPTETILTAYQYKDKISIVAKSYGTKAKKDTHDYIGLKEAIEMYPEKQTVTWKQEEFNYNCYGYFEHESFNNLKRIKIKEQTLNTKEKIQRFEKNTVLRFLNKNYDSYSDNSNDKYAINTFLKAIRDTLNQEMIKQNHPKMKLFVADNAQNFIVTNITNCIHKTINWYAYNWESTTSNNKDSFLPESWREKVNQDVKTTKDTYKSTLKILEIKDSPSTKKYFSTSNLYMLQITQDIPDEINRAKIRNYLIKHKSMVNPEMMNLIKEYVKNQYIENPKEQPLDFQKYLNMQKLLNQHQQEVKYLNDKNPQWMNETIRNMKAGQDISTAILNTMPIRKNKYVKQHFSLNTINMFIKTDEIKDINNATELRKHFKNTYTMQHISTFVDTFNLLKEKYPNLKMKDFIKNYYKYNLYDVQTLLNAIKDNPEMMAEYKNSKIRIRDIHNYLSTKQKEIAIKNKHEWKEKYFIDERIMNNLNRKINGYDFTVVPNTKTLIEIAEKLHNCSASYNNKIGNTTQLVAVTDDNYKIIALLEIREGKVYQAKLVDNDPVKKNPTINNKVISFMKKAKIECYTNDVELKKVA